MWKIKGCTRCGGDLFLDRDQYGWQEHCLQCGYRGDLESIAEAKKQMAEGKKKPVRNALPG